MVCSARASRDMRSRLECASPCERARERMRLDPRCLALLDRTT